MRWLPRSVDDIRIARFGHSAVTIDSSGVWGSELLVVFGGVRAATPANAPSDQPHTALNDIQVYHVESDTWSAPTTSGRSGAADALPEPRAFHCAAAIGRCMYVYGGHVLVFEVEGNRKRRIFYSDVWVLDTDTWQWDRLPAQEVEPPKRDMASLNNLLDSWLLLFGGRNELGKTLGDLWAYDVSRNSWSLVKAGGPTPPPRKMHTAVMITARLVVFAGERDTGVLDDLWTLKGLEQGINSTVGGSASSTAEGVCRWTQIRLRPAPQGRFGHAMAVSYKHMVTFGGCLDASSFLSLARNYVQCNELWLLDLASFSWHRGEDVPLEASTSGAGDAHVAAASPSERMCHTLTQLKGGRMLLLGGRRKDGICEDTWWLDMEAFRQSPAADALASQTPASQQCETWQASQAERTPSTVPISGDSFLTSLLHPQGLKGSRAPAQAAPRAAAAGAGSDSGATTPSPRGSQAGGEAAGGQGTESAQASGWQVPGSLLPLAGLVNDTAQSAFNRFSSTVNSFVKKREEGWAAPGTPTITSNAEGVAVNPLAQQQQQQEQQQQQYQAQPLQINSEGALLQSHSSSTGARYEAAHAAADAAAFQDLRTRKLGLPVVPQDFGTTHSTASLSSATSDTTQATARLRALGEQLLDANIASASECNCSAGDALDLVSRARSYLALLPPDSARLSHLDVVLADYKQLAAEQLSLGWQGAAASMGGSVAGQAAPAGGSLGSSGARVAGSSAAVVDYSELLAMVSSLSRPFASASLEDLRVSDAPALLEEYRQLLQLKGLTVADLYA